MAPRTPLVAGNWKCHKTAPEAATLAQQVRAGLQGLAGAEVVVCPPYPALSTVGDALRGSSIHLGAQDCFWEDAGAFTGQVSAPMLAAVGCAFVIVGHSERRGRFGASNLDTDLLAHFNDTNAAVNRKLRAALRHGLRPIVCVGETLPEREDGRTDSVVRRQVEAAVQEVAPDEAGRLTIAYEPVWAIGTGEHCDPDEANRIAGLIRMTLLEVYGPEVGIAACVLYGGSVTPDNAGDFFAFPEIDGALVGGASLEAARFVTIVELAVRKR